MFNSTLIKVEQLIQGSTCVTDITDFYLIHTSLITELDILSTTPTGGIF